MKTIVAIVALATLIAAPAFAQSGKNARTQAYAQQRQQTLGCHRLDKEKQATAQENSRSIQEFRGKHGQKKITRREAAGCCWLLAASERQIQIQLQMNANGANLHE